MRTKQAGTRRCPLSLISFGWCWSEANSNDSKYIQDGPRYLHWWPGRITLRSGASLALLFTRFPRSSAVIWFRA